MAQKILGLDLGAHSVKGLVLEGSLRGFTVAQSVSVRRPTVPAPALPATTVEGEAPPPPPDTLAPAVRELMERLAGVDIDAVAISVPGSTTSTPLLTLPFTDARKVEATLSFEVEGLIPFDIDEVFYDHQVLSQKNGKSDLLVGVTRREELLSLLANLHAAGVDPRVVTLPSLAYQMVMSELPAGAGEDAVALLDIGHERTSLVVSEGEGEGATLVYSRTFAGGGADLTRALARELSVSEAEAEAHKEREGSVAEGDGSRVAAVLRRALAPLVREIRQSLRAAQARSRKQVVRIRLAGGTALLPGLPELLARELSTRVEVVAFPAGAATVAAGDQPRMTQALGLGLRAQSRSGKLLNFRKGGLAFKGDLDYLRGKVSRLVAFAAVLVLLLGGSLWARIHSLKVQEDQLDAALCDVTQKVLGTCEKDFNVAISKLKGGDTKAASIPTASALEILGEVAGRMPPNVGARVTDLDAGLDRVRLKGVVDNFDGVDEVVAGLKKSACVGDIKRGKVQKNKEDKVEFQLDVPWVCGQNADKAGS